MPTHEAIIRRILTTKGPLSTKEILNLYPEMQTVSRLKREALNPLWERHILTKTLLKPESSSSYESSQKRTNVPLTGRFRWILNTGTPKPKSSQ